MTMRRTIPACAGEPVGVCFRSGLAGDYPRVCGGTGFRHVGSYGCEGLSPRVRGNHQRAACLKLALRTIPACAGEPRTRRAVPVAAGDYPRVCGGTRIDCRITSSNVGLSPRVRGNPRAHATRRPGRRTIPACAGEPAHSTWIPAVREDYPRVCGGTPLVL